MILGKAQFIHSNLHHFPCLADESGTSSSFPLPGSADAFRIDIAITAANEIAAALASAIGTFAAATAFFKLKENNEATQSVMQRELNTLES